MIEMKMKPKDTIKLDIVERDNPRRMCYLKMVYTNINVSLLNNVEIKTKSDRLYLE